jgi:hypothetical protein
MGVLAFCNSPENEMEKMARDTEIGAEKSAVQNTLVSYVKIF